MRMQEWTDAVTEPPMPAQPPRNAVRSTPARAWRAWRPAVRTWLWVAAAFAIGLVLFMAYWWRDRGNDFYRAQALPDAAQGQQFEPLPAPLPASEAAGNASGLAEPSDEAPSATPAPQPHIVPAPAAPRAPTPAGPTAPAPAAAFTPPVPIRAPAPGYPPAAYRNGDSGTVLLRVHVDPLGMPYAIDLVQSSRSRELDRAASDAVKRWRFQPAQRNGQPVAGEVQVPITFNADR
jgi:protein TonB